MPTVEEMMTRHVLTVTQNQTLEEAAQAMIERRIGSAVVVDGEGFIGIVTERDVLRAVARGMVPWSTKILDVMTHKPVTVPPEMDIREAIRIMIEGGFRHLPISKDGSSLDGLVSLRELLRSTALPKMGVTLVPDNAAGLGQQ